MSVRGDHEDSEGAYCTEHGVTLLFRGDPITPEDLGHECPRRPERYALPPAEHAHPH